MSTNKDCCRCTSCNSERALWQRKKENMTRLLEHKPLVALATAKSAGFDEIQYYVFGFDVMARPETRVTCSLLRLAMLQCRTAVFD